MYDPDVPKPLSDAPWWAKPHFTTGEGDRAPDAEPAAEAYEAVGSMDDLIQGLHPGDVPRHDADWQAQYEARLDTARNELWKDN